MNEEKSIFDHVLDFWDGVRATPDALMSLGVYIGRLSGYVDSEVNTSVILGTQYIEQEKAINEALAVKELLSSKQGRTILRDELSNYIKEDFSERPAYYIAQVLTAQAFQKALTKALEVSAKNATLVNVSLFGLREEEAARKALNEQINKLRELGLEDSAILNLLKEFNEVEDYWNYYDNNKMDFDLNNLWNLAQNFRWPVDPLVLDLDGDGIETLGVNADTHVLFDHDADGVKTGTGWICGDDGFLVLDRNGNGTIDSGRELFGDQTIVAGQNK